MQLEEAIAERVGGFTFDSIAAAARFPDKEGGRVNPVPCCAGEPTVP